MYTYNQANLVDTIIKANQVIESCLNQAHIKGARKYVNQVFKTYSSKSGITYKTEPAIFQIYADLMNRLRIKENSL